jgi:hypothetical protein
MQCLEFIKFFRYSLQSTCLGSLAVKADGQGDSSDALAMALQEKVVTPSVTLF